MDKVILGLVGITALGAGAYFLLGGTGSSESMGAGGGSGGGDSKKEEMVEVTRTEPVTNPSQPIFNIQAPTPPIFPSPMELYESVKEPQPQTTKKSNRTPTTPAMSMSGQTYDKPVETVSPGGEEHTPTQGMYPISSTPKITKKETKTTPGIFYSPLERVNDKIFGTPNPGGN